MANFSLLAKLGMDSSGFQTGIDQADSVRKKFQKGLGKLKLALAALGIGKVTMDAIRLGSQISDMAVQLNIGAEALQVFEFAAREAGVETGIMERAIRNVQLRTQQGIEGNKRYAEAYKTLGLNIETVQRLPVEKKLEAIAIASGKATNKQAAYNAVAAILGERAGPKMQEILQSLAKDGFDEVSRAAKESGTVMSDETIARMDEAADTIEQAKRAFTVLAAEITAIFLPVIKTVTREFVRFTEKFKIGINRALEAVGLEKVFNKTSTAVSDLADSSDVAAQSQGELADEMERTNEAMREQTKLSKDLAGLKKKTSEMERDLVRAQMRGDEDAINKLKKKIALAKQIEKFINMGFETQEAVNLAQKAVMQKASTDTDGTRGSMATGGISSFAAIAGGGRVGTLKPLSERQLSEATKQTKVLEKIEKNTAKNLTPSFK